MWALEVCPKPLQTSVCGGFVISGKPRRQRQLPRGVADWIGVDVHHPNGKRPNVEAKALHNMCCQPTCAAPATTRVASQVPLCEPHLMDVFSATNRLLAAEKSREGQYALLHECKGNR